MGNLHINNMYDKVKEIPDCCANCKYNKWNEYGCHCRNPKNWEPDDYEKELNLPLMMDDPDDDGEITWSICCPNHERGLPFY